MDEFVPITTQEQFDSMIQSRLGRAESSIKKQYGEQIDELKTANATLQKSLDEAKTGRDELTKQIADLNATITGLKTEELKTKIAIEAGIPLEMRSRLNGSTEDEIRADAEALAKYVIAKPAQPLRSNEPPVGDSETALYKKMLSELKIQ